MLINFLSTRWCVLFFHVLGDSTHAQEGVLVSSELFIIVMSENFVCHHPSIPKNVLRMVWGEADDMHGICAV